MRDCDTAEQIVEDMAHRFRVWPGRHASRIHFARCSESQRAAMS
jgi:hypothetical protein